jgi:DNA-binding NarL/FixJ family response regulator
MVPARAPKTYSILLAHSLTLLREGMAALCRAEPQYHVLNGCSDGATALRLIESQKPDIVLLDFNLTGLSTLEIMLKLRKAQASTRIVLLSARRDRKTVLEALRVGVNAFVLESDPAHYLFAAFASILDGTVYISPSLKLNQLFGCQDKADLQGSMRALSPREHQVFSLLVEGIRAKEIGARLGLNPKTIDTYRANLMRKLDIHSVAGLVKFALERDLAAHRSDVLVQVE